MSLPPKVRLTIASLQSLRSRRFDEGRATPARRGFRPEAQTIAYRGGLPIDPFVTIGGFGITPLGFAWCRARDLFSLSPVLRGFDHASIYMLGTRAPIMVLGLGFGTRKGRHLLISALKLGLGLVPRFIVLFPSLASHLWRAIRLPARTADSDLSLPGLSNDWSVMFAWHRRFERAAPSLPAHDLLRRNDAVQAASAPRFGHSAGVKI